VKCENQNFTLPGDYREQHTSCALLALHGVNSRLSSSAMTICYVKTLTMLPFPVYRC